MNAPGRIRFAAFLSLLSASSASLGAVIPFAPLPLGAMTSIPARAPSHVAAGDRVAGLFVGLAPATHGSPDYKRFQIFDSQHDAAEFASKGYVSSQDGGAAAPRQCVFVADESSAAGDAWSSLARGEIATFTRSGQNPVVGVHVETLEDGSPPSHPASLDIVDAWLDTRTRGLKLVAKSSIPLNTVAEGPYGIRVLAARDDDSVHFVVLPPTPSPKDTFTFGNPFERGIIDSGGEVGTSQCQHNRVSLRALPGAGEHAIISFQHTERAARQASDAEPANESPADAIATARVRLVQVHLSASRNASAGAPLVSVSFRVDAPKPFGSTRASRAEPASSVRLRPRRIHLRSGDIGGKCLLMRAFAYLALLLALAGCSDDAGADSKLGSQVGRSDGGKDATSMHEAAPPVKDVRESAAPNPHPGDAALAPEQCPIEGNGCPDECTAIAGYRVDIGRSCRIADPLVACSRRSIFGDAVTCRVRTSDSAVYYFTTSVLGPPYYEGWRACTSSEQQAALGASSACP